MDLPSIFELNNSNSHKPTLVILGQDSKSTIDTSGIGIGTPYGLHHQGSRDKITKFYFGMIKVPVQLSYRVYLTDIFKVWVCKPNYRYHRASLPKIDKDRFILALKKEFQAIKPSKIIIWGQEAANSLRKVDLDFQFIEFPHPSSAAAGTWKKLLGKSPTNENKLEYWRREVLKAL